MDETQREIRRMIRSSILEPEYVGNLTIEERCDHAAEAVTNWFKHHVTSPQHRGMLAAEEGQRAAAWEMSGAFTNKHGGR